MFTMQRKCVIHVYLSCRMTVDYVDFCEKYQVFWLKRTNEEKYAYLSLRMGSLIDYGDFGKRTWLQKRLVYTKSHASLNVFFFRNSLYAHGNYQVLFSDKKDFNSVITISSTLVD